MSKPNNVIDIHKTIKLFGEYGGSIKVYENTRNLKIGDRVVVTEEDGTVYSDSETNKIYITEIYAINKEEVFDGVDYVKTDLGGWYPHTRIYKIKE